MLSKHTVECIKVFLWNRISELFSSSVCLWAFFFVEAVIVKEQNETVEAYGSVLSQCTVWDRGLQSHSQRGCTHWASVFKSFLGRSLATCRCPIQRALPCV
jgi:hypothetical protein